MRNHAAPRFRGGVNIAMKTPPHLWDATVRFYTETLGLQIVDRTDTSVAVEYGPNRLWIDRVPAASHAEVWLELIAEDVGTAARELAAAGVARRDEIEALPDGFRGFWIANPAQVITLVAEPGE